ncbi:MAG: hypothetical protein AB8G96_12440 [Phycisphaerales bacterium]
MRRASSGFTRTLLRWLRFDPPPSWGVVIAACVASLSALVVTPIALKHVGDKAALERVVPYALPEDARYRLVDYVAWQDHFGYAVVQMPLSSVPQFVSSFPPSTQWDSGPERKVHAYDRSRWKPEHAIRFQQCRVQDGGKETCVLIDLTSDDHATVFVAFYW